MTWTKFFLFFPPQPESFHAGPPRPGRGGGWHQDATVALPKPYLCTGFDAFVLREPCTM